MTRQPATTGFTLAELLIAIALIGVVAAFSIPKIFQASYKANYSNIAKHAISALAEAHTIMRLNGELVPMVTRQSDLIKKHINATRVYDDSVDSPFFPPITSVPCNAPERQCYKLSSGAIIFFGANDPYYQNRNGINDALLYAIDPDGKASGVSANLPSLYVFIYPNGQVVSYDAIKPNTTITAGNGFVPASSTHNPDPARVAPWFKW